MKKHFKILNFCITAIMALTTSNAFCQQVEDSLKTRLIKSMEISEQAWNTGDLKNFMQYYWKSDSLRFMGKSGITFGWQNTLNRYIKNYPNTDIMGKLKFEIISIEYIGKENILMVGKWNLFRKTDKLDGHFSLIWKKFGNEWFIIFDHSS